MGLFECSPDDESCGPGFSGPEPGGSAFDLVNWILQLAAAILIWTRNLFAFLVKILLSIFHALGKFLLHVWQNFIRKAVTWLASHYQKLRAWLKRTIGPIIARLEKIKKWYDDHILRQQLRMLQILQTIRRFLRILRLFHVRWAATLDNALADIQQRIEQSIAIVRGTLNQIITTLALLLDPTLLITRNVLGGSLLSNLGAIKRIFGYGDNRILSASEQATIDHDHKLYYTSTVDAYVKTLRTSGPTDDDRARVNDFVQALSETTNTTLPSQLP